MPRASVVNGGAAASALHHHVRLRWLAIGIVALVALLFPAIYHPRLRLIWNVSASVPAGLYGIKPGVLLQVGDLVAVRPSPALTRYMAERGYVEAGALLIKPIAAMHGATVCRKGFGIMIAGKMIATALSHDRFGRPLPRWSSCRQLRGDQLFLIAPSTASFDSRYFGAVDGSQIVGRATPLWTFL